MINPQYMSDEMKISVLNVGLSPYKLFVGATPEAPKTTQAIATALGCPPELGDKTLWLKIQHTLVAGHREVKQKLTC